MSKKYLPHHWLNFKALSVIWTVFFYLTLAFGLYAAYNWILVLQLPAEFWQTTSAPLKQIYGYAAGAALLACTAELAVLRMMAVLKKTKKALDEK